MDRDENEAVFVMVSDWSPDRLASSQEVQYDTSVSVVGSRPATGEPGSVWMH